MDYEDIRMCSRPHRTSVLTIPSSSWSNSSSSNGNGNSNSDMEEQSSQQEKSTMAHPAQEINRISLQIVNGDYDTAIFSLTKTLKDLKLLLSGDAKISTENNWMDECDDYGENANANANEPDKSRSYYLSPPPTLTSSSTSTSSSILASSTSQACVFEYDFYSSPTSSYFLETSIKEFGGNSFHSNNINITSCATHNTTQKGFCEPSSARHLPRQQEHRCQPSIFRNPLIVRGDNFWAPLDANLCEELSYVVIYNLALSHQLKSLSVSFEQQMSQAYLHKALVLYEYSHQIFKNQSINAPSPAIHCMALVSNLGQIHTALGDHTKADKCTEYLLSILMYTIYGTKRDESGSTGTTTPSTASEKGQHTMLMDGFFGIVEHLIFTKGCTAPAA